MRCTDRKERLSEISQKIDLVSVRCVIALWTTWTRERERLDIEKGREREIRSRDRERKIKKIIKEKERKLFGRKREKTKNRVRLQMKQERYE